MTDAECVTFLQWALPRLRMRWPGFRKVRRTVGKRISHRMSELGLENVESYRAYLECHAGEWDRLDTYCRIPISRFHRDRGVFELLGREILPALAEAARARGNRSVRAWSAGCASGEEPYTLAILWARCDQCRRTDLPMSILATDAEPKMLERATCGVYGAGSLKDVPASWMADAFERIDDLYRVRDEHRRAVDFQLQDIRRELPAGPFDLVLCRHLVFTYFDEDLQREILPRLLTCLVDGGVLVTGKQETVPEGVAGLTPCAPRTGVYRAQERAPECS